jgi:SAM-dependent methyltransferase
MPDPTAGGRPESDSQTQHAIRALNDLATHSERMHRLVRAFISKGRPRAKELTGFDVYFDLRGTEFLLLLVRLSKVEGLQTRRILEVGCGAGFNLRLWGELAELAVGSDLPDEIRKAERVLELFPPLDQGEIRLIPGTGEDFAGIEGEFDLILTEYVLEHVQDLTEVLANIRTRLAPGGMAVHVLPNLTDRHDWYVSYRLQTSWPARLRASVAERGVSETALTPFEHTTAHEPSFGNYAHEHAGYRLEEWAARILEQGFEIVDFFSTRDVNTVLVTRVLDAA